MPSLHGRLLRGTKKALSKKGGADMAVGVHQAPRDRLGAPPVQWYMYIYNVHKTHRVVGKTPYGRAHLQKLIAPEKLL